MIHGLITWLSCGLGSHMKGFKMVIKDGKIIKCTEAELFMFWLQRWSNLIDFYTYKKKCQELGTEVINDDN